MEFPTNQVILRGNPGGRPEFSHENHGKRFFRFPLDVPRLSGAVDTLPILAEERLLEDTPLLEADWLTVTGQVRSHNHREDGRRRLLVFVFATALAWEDGEPLNQVLLEGILCREPTYRRTPLGREICDGMLAVPRAFRRSDYLPCIFWGRTAQEAAACHVRDRVHLEGRLQSRGYTKLTEEGAQQRIAYEISALTARFSPPEGVEQD